MQFTHKDLVSKARIWLGSRSPVTVTEISTNAGEEPDALGFCVNLKNNKSYIGYGSVLIECKASRSDYLADKKKMYRRKPEYGMGDYRYFMTPQGLIKVDELPESWGLLEVLKNGRIKMTKIPERQESNKIHEITVLVSTLRRLNIYDGDHVSIKKYTYETKNKASLTIWEDTMKKQTEEKLRIAEEICIAEDRSDGYTIQFMMDYAGVSPECVMNYFKKNKVKEKMTGEELAELCGDDEHILGYNGDAL